MTTWTEDGGGGIANVAENVGVDVGDVAVGAEELARRLDESRVDEEVNLFRDGVDEGMLASRWSPIGN